ncbi:SDR family NAD(P)-dependent oxidoreductase, partial [Lutimaribacter sp. EGI FJ00015]|nr:SDR family NAD(P)-dependent oxidoreductase [Lutimaribacter sp. EGI FJ00015]
MAVVVGKHALVTGGGSGVGKAIALTLADAGIQVTICGRRIEALEMVAGEHPHIHAIAGDVTDQASMDRLYRDAEAARGPVDIVIANAGISSSAPAAKTTLDAWKKTMDVNLTGAFVTVQPALEGMAAQKKGRII